jgi:hypothetical protein
MGTWTGDMIDEAGSCMGMTTNTGAWGGGGQQGAAVERPAAHSGGAGHAMRERCSGAGEARHVWCGSSVGVQMGGDGCM